MLSGPAYVKEGVLYCVPSISIFVSYPNDEADKKAPSARSFFKKLVFIKINNKIQ